MSAENVAWCWGGGLGLGTFSAFMLGQVAVRVRNRFRHPVIVRPVP